MRTNFDELACLVSGGWALGRTKDVLRFDSNNLNNDPVEIEKMVEPRYRAGCSIFKSSVNGGRPVIIAVGGFSGFSDLEDTAEVWDFTREGTTWQLSKIKFCLLMKHSKYLRYV